MTYTIHLARVYTAKTNTNSKHILVDRLWPRGIKKETLQLDFWAKAVSPSHQLRKSWYAQELSFAEFRQQYTQELNQLQTEIIPLLQAARQGEITLLTSVKEVNRSHLVVLKDWILDELAKEDREDNAPSSPPCYWHEFEPN